MNLKESAISYLAAGLCPLPALLKDKKPSVVTWKAYQSARPTPKKLFTLFTEDTEAICILTGKASNSAEVIDFDNRAELFNQWLELITSRDPGLAAKLVIESTQ